MVRCLSYVRRLGHVISYSYVASVFRSHVVKPGAVFAFIAESSICACLVVKCCETVSTSFNCLFAACVLTLCSGKYEYHHVLCKIQSKEIPPGPALRVWLSRFSPRSLSATLTTSILK